MQPQPAAYPARYFNGDSGQRVPVLVDVDAASRVLTVTMPDGAPIATWPLDELFAQVDHARNDALVLARRAVGARDGALTGTERLTLKDPSMIAQLRALCPDLTRGRAPKGTALRVAKFTGLAVGAVALMLFVVLPRLAGTLADVIPIQREIAFGKSVVGQIESVLGGSSLGGLTCDGPEGSAALARLTARLQAGTPTEYDLTVSVMDHEMVNAFAAPGGQVVVMRGLIENASGPAALAAVLAHEIGHVEARDSTRNALRAAGSAGLVSLLIGDFAGGSLAVILADQVLQAGYTREAEARADLFALGMLDAAAVDATGMAAFFRMLQERDRVMPDLPVYLSSHPRLEGRAALADDFASRQSGTTAVMSDGDWAALQAICD